MNTLVDIGLRNAALAVPLAAVVLLLSLVLRRPALLHLLWVLVLLRLVMPPLWNVAVPRPVAAAPAIVADTAPLNEPAEAAPAVLPPSDLAADAVPAPETIADPGPAL